MTIAALVPWGDTRPLTRGECLGRPRPCPWVSCRHHLYLDANPERPQTLRVTAAAEEPWDLVESCSLDLADRGPLTLEATGVYLGVTRERVRQIESVAIEFLATLKTVATVAAEVLETRPVTRSPEPEPEPADRLWTSEIYPRDVQMVRRVRTIEGLSEVLVHAGGRDWTIRRSPAGQWEIDDLPGEGWSPSSVIAARRLLRILAGTPDPEARPTPALRAVTCDRCHSRPPTVGAPGQPLLCGECAAKDTPMDTPMDTPDQSDPIASRLAGITLWVPIPQGSGRALSPEAIAAARDLVAAGHRVTQVAAAIGCARSVVDRRVRDLVANRQRQRPTVAPVVVDPDDPTPDTTTCTSCGATARGLAVDSVSAATPSELRAAYAAAIERAETAEADVQTLVQTRDLAVERADRAEAKIAELTAQRDAAMDRAPMACAAERDRIDRDANAREEAIEKVRDELAEWRRRAEEAEGGTVVPHDLMLEALTATSRAAGTPTTVIRALIDALTRTRRLVDLAERRSDALRKLRRAERRARKLGLEVGP